MYVCMYVCMYLRNVCTYIYIRMYAYYVMLIDHLREMEKRSNNETKPSSDAAQHEENGTITIPINVESNVLSTDQGIATYVYVRTYVCTYV